tara:strand:+ start:48 stop:2645 length:2598 start_codon:yes stop_codon:yes gene_type:complete
MDRTQLNKATAENPNPPPGYIYSEIAKWTHNNPSVNQQLEKYLMAKLKKNNPFVKWKVCLIIKHTCGKANVGFKRCMQRHTDKIKACMQYRGPPHATLGDTPYVNVRQEAKAAVEAIFAESTQQQTQGLQSKITSMSSNGNGSASQQGNGQGQQHAAFNSGGGGRYQTNTSSNSSNNNGSGGRYGGSNNSSGSSGSSGAHSSAGRSSGQAQMGAEGTAGSGSYRGASGRAMVGQGNPNFKDPRNKKPGFFDKVNKMVSKKKTNNNNNNNSNSGNGSNPNFMNNPTGAKGYNYASNRGPNAIGSSGYGAPDNSTANSNSNGYANSNGVKSPARRNSGTRKQGGVGGSWGGSGGDIKLNTTNNSNNNNSNNSNNSNSSSNNRNNNSSSSNGTMPMGKAGNALSDGAYETQLVDNICAPGGLRPRPATADVKKFIARCKTLDAEMMAGLLVDRVCSDDWTVSAKALIVIDELAKDESCASFADYFYDQKDIFEEEMNDSEQKMVRDRAKKVLVTLGVEGLDTKTGGKTGRRRGKAALPDIPNVDDVLGGGGLSLDADVQNSSSSVTSATTAAATNDQDDLLGMFGSSTATPVAAVTVATVPTPAPIVPVASNSGVLDMFSDMGATTTSTTSTPSTSIGGFDFMTATPAAPTAPSTTTAPIQTSMLLPSATTSVQPMQPMQPMTSSQPMQPVMNSVQPITSAFDGLDMKKGTNTAATSQNFAFQQQAQQRQQQQQQQQRGSGGLGGMDPLAGLSGIAPSVSSQGGLLGMDFSKNGMNQANQQQKMQQVMKAQQRQGGQQQQQQQGMGMGMGMRQPVVMGMQGMGGIRQMQPGNNQPLPDFNNQSNSTNTASQGQTKQKKTNDSFGGLSW